MTIEFRDDREFIGLWFAVLPQSVPLPHGAEGGDFMLAAFRDKRDGAGWEVVYRFRYYLDDKTHGSEDKKSWYHFETSDMNTTASDVEMQVQKMFAALGLRPDFVDMRGAADAIEMAERLGKAPWAHVRVENTAGSA